MISFKAALTIQLRSLDSRASLSDTMPPGEGLTASQNRLRW